MSRFSSRLVRSCALWLTLGQGACSSSSDGGADDAAISVPSETLDAASADAAKPARDAGRATDAGPVIDAARLDAGGDAALDAALVFKPSYGPCPAPLSCDPFIYYIANDLIRKEFSDAPSNVSACIQPNLPFPAVPACYEPGPCRINHEAGNIEVGFEVGICLGMEAGKVGYCLKPCT